MHHTEIAQIYSRYLRVTQVVTGFRLVNYFDDISHHQTRFARTFLIGHVKYTVSGADEHFSQNSRMRKMYVRYSMIA